jgi:NADH-quinone oxidoreductase subunit L
MFKMGGLRRSMPVTFITMAAGWLAIVGIAPFAGFWSKDEILFATFSKGGWWLVLWGLGLVVAVLTAFYMTRLFVLTFIGASRWDEAAEPHESPPSMTVPLILLGIGTLGLGLWNTPFRLSLEHFLEPSFEGVPHPEAASIEEFALFAGMVLLLAVIGLAVAWHRYTRDPLPDESGSFWRNALAGFHVDDAYGRYVVAPGKAVAAWCASVFDPKVIDGVTGGVARGVKELGTGTSSLQTGQVRWYATGMAVAGVVVIIALLLIGGAF